LLLTLAAVVLSGVAHAGPDTTRDSLDRLEEVLELRIEDGRLVPDELLPAVLVSAEPRYVASEDWFSTRVIEVLQGALGEGGIRLCEACMAPRAYVEDGRLAYSTGPADVAEIIRLDEQTRGSSQAARSAIWVDEHRGGVSIRIVDLATGQVRLGQNIDPGLMEHANSERMYSLSAELERRARGDSLTQAFVDFAVYPGQHISMDWTDQWGKTNAQMSGITLSVIDPILGIGGCHYSRVEPLNMLVGGQVVVALPTALARSFSDPDLDLLDPLVTVAGVLRVPFGRSNYGGVLTISTNGQVGFGLSLMNISPIPVLL